MNIEECGILPIKPKNDRHPDPKENQTRKPQTHSSTLVSIVSENCIKTHVRDQEKVN